MLSQRQSPFKIGSPVDHNSIHPASPFIYCRFAAPGQPMAARIQVDALHELGLHVQQATACGRETAGFLFGNTNGTSNTDGLQAVLAIDGFAIPRPAQLPFKICQAVEPLVGRTGCGQRVALLPLVADLDDEVPRFVGHATNFFSHAIPRAARSVPSVYYRVRTLPYV